MPVEFISDLDIENQLSKFETPSLVVFWANWWEQCIDFDPILNRISEEFNKKIQIFKVDTDKYRQLFNQYDFYNTPTVVFFRSGKPVAQYASIDYRLPYRFESIADFIEECLNQGDILEKLDQVFFVDNLNHVKANHITAEQLLHQLKHQKLPILLFSYWSHKEHELAPKIEQAFDQLYAQDEKKYNFFKLDRTTKSDEMKYIDENYELNFLAGKAEPYPVIYAFENGKIKTSTLDNDESAWFYFHNNVIDFPINKLLSIMLHKINTV